MVDVALPPGFPGTFGGMEAMDGKDIAQMMIGLSRAFDKLAAKDKEKFDAVGFYMYIPQIRGIFRNGKYAPELGQMFINRINSLPPGLTKEWQDAMAATISESEDSVNAMLQLMQCEPLWMGVEWNNQRAQKALNRLRSLTPAALKEWSKVSSSKSMVALSLVNTNALFQGDAFNASIFQEALPIAVKLYDERAAKLK